MVACGCFKRKSKAKEKPPVPEPPKSSRPLAEAKPVPRISMQLPVPPKRTLHTFDSPHVKYSTYFSEKDIIEMKMTPRETMKKTVHFACPICMSYFNTILVSKCCNNYVCHNCVKSIAEGNFEVCCPQCKADPLVLADVDMQKSVKMYSDSFANPRMNQGASDHSPALNTIPEIDTARRDSFDDLPVKDSPVGMDDSFRGDNRV